MEMDTMVTVHDALTSRVITVEPQTSVAEAAKIMTEMDIGSLVIKSNAKPEGLITESDIIAKVVSQDLKASQIPVGDLMTQSLIVTHPGSELNEAARLMARNNIRRLPVVNNGVLVGILTTTDVVMVSPELTEILVENARMENSLDYSNNSETVPGACEVCGNYIEYLDEVDGKFVCEECKEDLEGE